MYQYIIITYCGIVIISIIGGYKYFLYDNSEDDFDVQFTLFDNENPSDLNKFLLNEKKKNNNIINFKNSIRLHVNSIKNKFENIADSNISYIKYLIKKKYKPVPKDLNNDHANDDFLNNDHISDDCINENINNKPYFNYELQNIISQNNQVNYNKPTNYVNKPPLYDNNNFNIRRSFNQSRDMTSTIDTEDLTMSYANNNKNSNNKNSNSINSNHINSNEEVFHSFISSTNNLSNDSIDSIIEDNTTECNNTNEGNININNL